MSTAPATDWTRIFDALGDNRRLVIQKGTVPGTVELRVEERDPMGYRISQLVSREATDHAAFDLIGATVDECSKQIDAKVR